MNSSSNNVVRFPIFGREPLFFERRMIDQRREIAMREIDECLGGALQLMELADSRRMEFGLDLNEYCFDEAREDLLRVLAQLDDIKKGAR
jgi:hypothetical protein